MHGQLSYSSGAIGKKKQTSMQWLLSKKKIESIFSKQKACIVFIDSLKDNPGYNFLYWNDEKL